jgi:hypothetical protein
MYKVYSLILKVKADLIHLIKLGDNIKQRFKVNA